MVRVVAKERGYFGGEIREPGARFVIPDDLWEDKARRPKWAKLDPGHAFGGKGDHDGNGEVGGSKSKASDPAGDKAGVVIPADWQNKSAAERKALAKAITGQNVPNATEADKIISAYVETSKPEPFGDAPEPETVKPGNGLQAALGGVQPDWVAPGSDAPKPVAD